MSRSSVVIPDESVFAEFRERCLSKDNWVSKYKKNGMEVWVQVSPVSAQEGSKNHVSKIHTIKCRMIISDVSADTMYDVLHDGSYRKKWDPTVLESFDIARVAPNADVGYYSWICPKPLKNRDVVTLRTWQVKDHDHMIINYCSLPKWVVNTASQYLAPKVMRSVHKAGQMYPDWKRQNSPDKKPWYHPEQSDLPLMEVSELAIQRGESLENVDESGVRENRDDEAEDSG
ncbi:STA10 protein, partial [Amia calva]|nr:STA10 protein [Amia calva]